MQSEPAAPGVQQRSASAENSTKRDGLSVIGSCFLALAEVAPSLKEAELRVLLHLVHVARDKCAAGSSRELASATNLSRRNVQHALDSLAKRRLISVRQGTATRSSAFYIHLFDSVRISSNPPLGGGAVMTPPPVEKPVQVALFQRQGGAVMTPPVALFQRQGGAVMTPPADANEELNLAPGVLFDRFDSIDTIDRLLKAKPKDFSTESLAWARSQIFGYMRKFGSEPAQHPPDDLVLAQFLSIAERGHLDRLLHDLMMERQRPGYSYGWFVTVALQRIHGIQPTALKARRSALRVARAPGGSGSAIAAAAGGSEQQTQSEMRSEIEALVERKRLP